VKCLLPTALLICALAQCSAAAQSFDIHNQVNAPFDAATYTPLTGQQRLQRWWQEDGGSPDLHMNAWITASFDQAANKPSQWGRTTGGMARRVGSGYAEYFIGNSIHETFAAAAGTDPRYFACACKGLIPRTGHAIEMTLLARDRSGHLVPDLPQLAGIYGGPMIARLWYPAGDSPLVQGVQYGHVQVGFLGLIHIAQEFSPELKAVLHIKNSHAIIQTRPQISSQTGKPASPQPTDQSSDRSSSNP